MQWRDWCTEYIFYCKRAILFLSSSKILTHHPPLRPGRTDSPGGEGDGGSIFWKTREIGLPSYSKICTLWIGTRGEDTDGGRSLSIGIHYLDTLFLGV